MTMRGVPRQEDARLPETACEYALHLPVVHADDLRIDVGQPQQFLQPRHDRFRIKLLGIVRLEGEVEQPFRSEEHTSELQSLMRISYAVFCLKKKNKT